MLPKRSPVRMDGSFLFSLTIPPIPRIAGIALACQQMGCHLAPGQDPKARDELGKCHRGIGLLKIMPDSHGPERKLGVDGSWSHQLANIFPQRYLISISGSAPRHTARRTSTVPLHCAILELEKLYTLLKAELLVKTMGRLVAVAAIYVHGASLKVLMKLSIDSLQLITVSLSARTGDSKHGFFFQKKS